MPRTAILHRCGLRRERPRLECGVSTLRVWVASGQRRRLLSLSPCRSLSTEYRLIGQPDRNIAVAATRWTHLFSVAAPGFTIVSEEIKHECDPWPVRCGRARRPGSRISWDGGERPTVHDEDIVSDHPRSHPRVFQDVEGGHRTARGRTPQG